MTKKKFFLTSSLILATLMGCQNDDKDVFNNTSNSEKMVITALLKSEVDSRSVLGADGKKVLWNAEDKLSVFLAYREGQNEKFGLLEGGGTGTAFFQGEKGQIIIGGTSAGTYTWSNVAYYPYDENITIIKNEDTYKLNVVFPTTQFYADKSFGQDASPMVAVTENKNDFDFVFENISALFSLTLKGNATITKVTLKNEALENDKVQPLAGNAIVSVANGVTPSTQIVDETSSTILLDCGEDGVKLTDDGTIFYFVIPAATYSTLTFTAYDNNGKSQSYTIKSLTFDVGASKNATREYNNPQEVVKVQLNGLGNYASIAEAVEAITDKTAVNTITLAAGTYKLPTSLVDLNLVIEGENADLPGEVVVDMSDVPTSGSQHQYGAKSVTFKNLTMKRPSKAYGGLAHITEAESYDNCIIEGTLVTYAPKIIVKNSTFKQTSNAYYNVHIYSPGTMEFEKCTFICEGKSIYMHHDGNHSEYNVTIKNSTFAANQVVTGKTAIQMHTEDKGNGDNGVYGSLTVEGTTASGFDSSINGGLWYELNNSTKNITYNFTKKIDGENPDGFEKVAENEYNIFKANGLVYAAKNLFLNGGIFNITADIDMTDVEYSSVDYNKDEEFIIKGNKNTIKGMSMPLINSTWSAEKLVKIQDLTLENPAVALDVEDTKETTAVGAFIASPGASTNIELNNCHVLGGSVKGGHWTGGLVGWAGGYNGTDGPVFEILTIVDCSVKNCTIEGKGSVGGIIGHAANCAWTLVDMDDITVSGNTITSTGDSDVKAGSVMGTVGAAQTYTVNGTTHNGYVSVDDATIENNTVVSNGTTINRIYGRQGSTGGILYVDGVQVIFEAAQLAASLTADKTNIDVVLGNDIDMPITSLGSITAGSGEYKLGGTSTEKINIDLNGKKLNITTTYWSAIGAKNDNATVTIKNGSMTSTGNSAGTWNAFDVRLSNCNYVIEKVIFDKPVALDNVGKSTKMNTVTINDDVTSSRYALWITAEGQTVEIDGLTINSGRGIKIDEQYVDSPAKVNLKVSNANFTTAKKAAILVKSAAGADITLSNVNINNVAADNVNVVWCDADAVQYTDLINVSGGTKINEN